MNTGFKGLDEIIDLNKPQLILLVDACQGSFAQMLSGDIANNITLKVGYDFMHKLATVNDIEEKFIVDGVDTIVILNDNEEKSNNDKDYLHFDVTVHTKEQEQKCTLKYTPKYRRFED